MTYMNNHLRSSLHTLVRIAALAAVAVGLLVAGAGTADAHHTSVTMNEGFEGPHGALRFFHTGAGSGGDLAINRTPVPVFNPQRARSGTGHAWLWTRSVGGTSTVERTVSKPRDYPSCYAWVWVNPEAVMKSGRFEAYDPVAGRVLTSVPFTVSSSGYQQLSTGYFFAWTPTVQVRVRMIGRTAGTEILRVDDLRVICNSFD